MSTHVDARSRTDSRSGRHVPAYGPVDAVLGLVLFYVVVDRATPSVLAVAGEIFPDVSSSAVGLGLAVLLWFVVAVTLLDQVRRQLAALGVGTHEAVRPSPSSRATLSEPRALAYLVVLVVGSLLAAWTYEPAIETAVSMVRVLASPIEATVVPAELAVMVVFFVSFGAATHSLDRLVIGGIRATLAD